ncbi:MAG: universal stress protein [Pirellulales bacterium]
MTAFRRAAVALSLTEPDVELLRYCGIVADLDGCEQFDFVHAIAAACQPDTIGDQPDLVRKMRDEIRAHFVAEAAELKTSIHVREGARIDALIGFVAEHESDLILLGHRKMRSGRRSLARRLAMVAPCSVWMVPEGAPAQISRVLAPIDFSEHSAASLSMATRIARLQGLAECLAVHVFFDPSTVRYDEHMDEVRGGEQEAFDRFIETVDCHGIRVTPLFEESANVAHAILRTAAQQAADLIVMSTRGRSRASAILLGSVTSQVLMESQVPTLAVKQFGAKLDVLHALFDQQFWRERSPKSN